MFMDRLVGTFRPYLVPGSAAAKARCDAALVADDDDSTAVVVSVEGVKKHE